MTIDWYPGHMRKARLQIAEAMPRIDLVIEVLDARLPKSSANPLLERLRRDKPCIKVLNKNDLADPAVTKAWVHYFQQQTGVRALPLEATQRTIAGQLHKLCRRLVPHRGKPGKPLRAMVMGIPNVGKSTLINTLAGKRITRVGDKPAITTCPQQVDLRNGIFIADTPGLLWPNLEDRDGAYRLAASGAIGDGAMDYADVAHFTAAYLMERYPQLLTSRYKLETLPATPQDLLEEIGRRRGCLAGGGEVDLQRTAEAFLRDLRGGKIGRISLEAPGEETARELGEEAAERA